MIQDLYDWRAAPPPAPTAELDPDSGDWFSEAEMEAHAEKARGFAARLEREGRLRGAAVLDVGCGMGHFLRECLDRGARQATGMEFRHGSVRYARQRLGVQDVRSAPLEDAATWRDGEFDLVCSFDVIEHVHDLAGFFASCVRVTRPGGALFHATPGADSVTHRLGRVASRCGARRLALTLTNLGYVNDLLGGPHVHLMGRRQVAWVAERQGLVARTAYVPSYSYTDRHYAAVVPQLRWLPRPIGAFAFATARRAVPNKLLMWMERRTA